MRQLSELEVLLEEKRDQIEKQLQAAMVPVNPGLYRDRHYGTHSILLTINLDAFAPEHLDIAAISNLLSQFNELREEEKSILEQIEQKHIMDSNISPEQNRRLPI